MRHAAALLLATIVAATACDGRAADGPRVTALPSDTDTDRRTRMVESQIVARGVRDPRVLAAMRKVPRHRFVDDAQRAVADDAALVLAFVHGVHALDAERRHRVQVDQHLDAGRPREAGRGGSFAGDRGRSDRQRHSLADGQRPCAAATG